MINPNCFFCSDELFEMGGILLSPPHGDSVKKMHVCVDCYNTISTIRMNHWFRNFQKTVDVKVTRTDGTVETYVVRKSDRQS